MSDFKAGSTTDQAAATLFLDTLEDLRRRSNLRASEYDMAQAAGLVRRLLIDGKPLYEAANRTHRFKFKFEWSRWWVAVPTGKPGLAWAQGIWLDPELSKLASDINFGRMTPVDRARASAAINPSSPNPSGGVREFLAHQAVSCSDTERGATVRDIVSLYAHEFGGVHYGMESKPNDLLVSMIPDSETYLRYTMVAIGRIVCRTFDLLASRLVLDGQPHPLGFSGGRPIEYKT